MSLAQNFTHLLNKRLYYVVQWESYRQHYFIILYLKCKGQNTRCFYNKNKKVFEEIGVFIL